MNAIALTDRKGALIHPYNPEPEPGSVVLTEGEYGTAWQRFFSDGKWHPTRGGGSRTWEQLLAKRNLVLVYEADKREKPGA